MKSRFLLFALSLCLAAGCSDDPTQPAPLPLTDLSNQADYILISPDELVPALEPLIGHRAGQGLTVRVATVEQITQEFDTGLSIEEIIRDFVVFTQGWESPSPRYVALVGDTDLIPSFLVESPWSGIEDPVPHDENYGIDPDNPDELLDIAIGRLPASNAAELEVIVNKLTAWPGENYAADALVVADHWIGEPLALAFEEQADEFIEAFPTGVTTIRLDVRDDSANHGTQTDFMRHLGAGVRVLYYLGAGSSTQWSNTSFLTTEDVPYLPATKPCMVVASGCSQPFHEDTRTIAEELLLLDSGGAIATLVSSGASFLHMGFDFVQRYQETLVSGNLTIGEALLQTKQSFRAGRNGALDKRFTLLGDPAMRIP